MVRFVKIEGNTRVLQLGAKNNDDWLYMDAEKNMNIGILEVAEEQALFDRLIKRIA